MAVASKMLDNTNDRALIDRHKVCNFFSLDAVWPKEIAGPISSVCTGLALHHWFTQIIRELFKRASSCAEIPSKRYHKAHY